MVKKVFTATPVALKSSIVEVEVAVTNGLPAIVIVGLPETAVQESKERVKAAIKHSNLPFPQTRVSVNLAPADLPKEGTHFDLPIALAILSASEYIQLDEQKKLFLGELSLDGRIKPVPGVLSAALAAKDFGFVEVYVPKDNVNEASVVEGIKVFGVENLNQLCAHFLGVAALEVAPPMRTMANRGYSYVDFKEIAGQEGAKHALEIACAGGHNVLMSGSPGAGKTLLAKALPGILPELTYEESIELTTIYSAAGVLTSGLIRERPVRSPHHTASSISLVGGGTNPRPGEVTLAHRGVLFLDEFPEFSRSVLEVLRQPLEDGVVTVARAKRTYTFPARFMLVAAQNPCPCGYFGDKGKTCVCSSSVITRYQRRLSGPLLDRIDLHVTVNRVEYSSLSAVSEAESSLVIRARVERARRMQYKRFGAIRTNAEMGLKEIKIYCQLDENCHNVLQRVERQYQLSARSIHRIIKVARTIADLDENDAITTHHLLQAIQFRLQDEGV